MGSAVVKQRTERKDKSSIKKHNSLSDNSSMKDKYEQMVNIDKNIAQSSPSELVSNETVNRVPHQQQIKASSNDILNRKKTPWGQRFKKFTKITKSDDELKDSASVEHSENVYQEVFSEGGEGLTSQTDESKLSNVLDKTNSLHSNAGSEKVGMAMAETENNAVSVTTAKENSDLDNTDVCRDARTPSPQFDELENVTLMSPNLSKKINSSSDEEKNLSVKGTASDIIGEGGKEEHSSGSSPISEEHSLEQPPENKPTDHTLSKHLPNDASALSDPPTVNHPVVENVLASGTDFVGSLDEKFVMRGSLSSHETNDPSEATGDSSTVETVEEVPNEREGSSGNVTPNSPRSEGRFDEQDNVVNSESPTFDDVFGNQRNNSQTANYNDWSVNDGLSQEKIECIQRQVFQEGLAPMRRDGGVSFFVPVEESGMRPLSANSQYPSRLKVSRRSGLSCDERMILADVNRSKEIDRRKEFAVKQNNAVKPTKAEED